MTGTRGRGLVACTLIAVAVHGAYTRATFAIPGLREAVTASYVYFDEDIYFHYASRWVAGEVPYRDFRVEYPVLAPLLFVAPRAVARDFPRYRVAFGAEMLLFDAALVYLLARRAAEAGGMARAVGRVAWYSLFVMVLSPMALIRYDLAPTALAFAAALAWERGRGGLGGLAAGVGALLKVFPVVVAVPAVIGAAGRSWGPRVRGALALAATLAAGGAAWAAWAGPRGLAESLRYHRDRGLELHSVYAGALYALARAGGREVGLLSGAGCPELATPWSGRVAAVAPAVQAAAVLLVAWRCRQAGGPSGIRAAASAVLAFVACNKVLSPQYLIWLAPFVAAQDGRTGSAARWLYLAACAATTALFPRSFAALTRLEPWAFALLNVRNLLLLGLLGLLLFGPEARACHAAGGGADLGGDRHD